MSHKRFTLLFTQVFIFIAFSSIGFAQKEIKKNVSNCTFDSIALDRLIQNDSLYEATVLLNEALEFSKKYNLKSTEAKTYNAFGMVLSEMGNYKNAQDYYYRALTIYDSLDMNKGKDIVLAGLISTYVDSKNYKKFDSIYPIAQKLSNDLNSEFQFINLQNKVKKQYYNYENDSLFESTNYALAKLDSTNFDLLNTSKEYDYPLLKERLQTSFKYYNAIAKVKISNFKEEGFDLLFTIEENDLKESIKDEYDKYNKLATFNYYKFLYYKDIDKNLDSATEYLLKSDTYKYDALRDYEKRNSKNGELIYKIITAEQRLNVVEHTRENETKLSQIFLYSTIITGFCLIIALILLYFYFKARKNISNINKELKQTNNKLLLIDKERLEFFSVLSHELRTPIYGINGLATLIEQEDNKDKKQSYLNSLISSTNYISILIDNVLQATKLSFEDKDLRLKPDKVVNILKHVTSSVEVAAEQKGLDFYVEIEDSDIDENILIDKVAFSQILINLGYNAIRYTKTGSVSIHVTEKSRTADDVTLHFEIRDTGIGIDDEHRSIIFNAFENKTFLNKNSRGSGLGLYIVKTLLKSHGSTIDFISEIGEGSTFFFDTTFKFSKTNPISKPKNDFQNDTPIHVLVVDDNKINLLITQKNIERIDNHYCETTHNGRESISIVKEGDFDLILMDINMPDMDGFEVTKHIRMFNPYIPILALTALNSNEIEDRAKQAGINQVITKPYNFEEFKSTIQKYSRTSIYA
ncbi:response regulator [Psychroserpens sp. Hel_I_66]|uniref:response regulator n=1 Tax=Psychroserpens sp. Hel_I_66 TaxID=1250004 RepID=UPI0006462240|nr:response regulator [Psychroserpens sp. Hel_I_66]